MNIYDKEGTLIQEGSFLFYSERPHSNYADSICHVYSHNGILKVETLVFNWEDEYVRHYRDPVQDLEVIDYTRDLCLNLGTSCENLTVIKDELTLEDDFLAYANEHYPLNQ